MTARSSGSGRRHPAMTGLKLQYKIVIPFVVLFVAATAVIAFTALSAISRTLDSRLSTQLERASAST